MEQRLQQLIERCKGLFAKKFGHPPSAIGVAPGRVEVLGNHTDYNHGFILAAAIDRWVVIAGGRVEGSVISVYSERENEMERFSASNCQNIDVEAGARCTWSRYVRGVAGVLKRDASVPIGAFNVCIVGDLPLGAGLSSSAALEVATGLVLTRLFQPPALIDSTNMALLCQRAENQWVGVQCGILDQFTVMHSRAGQLLFLDCRSLEFSHVPLPSAPPMGLVLANTNAHHTLVDGGYNRLRQLCFQAAEKLAKVIDHPVTHLRDISPSEFKQHCNVLTDDEAGRASHIVMEDERVQQARKELLAAHQRPDDHDLALRAVKVLGDCMCASHESSRHDFLNSCVELDAMVDAAMTVRQRDGLPCYGSRLSGGGFGGCTVNLVSLAEAPRFVEALTAEFVARTHKQPTMFICQLVDGAEVIDC